MFYSHETLYVDIIYLIIFSIKMFSFITVFLDC